MSKELTKYQIKYNDLEDYYGDQTVVLLTQLKDVEVVDYDMANKCIVFNVYTKEADHVIWLLWDNDMLTGLDKVVTKEEVKSTSTSLDSSLDRLKNIGESSVTN